jgi:predicted GNAT family acetyltransferase
VKYTSQRRRVAKHKILKHERSKIKNRWQQRLFYIAIDGKHEAMMTFVFAGDKQIIIDHTEVNPEMKAKVLANKW